MTPTPSLGSKSSGDRALSRILLRERLYIWLLIVLWAFVPGLRRVVDWLVGYGSLPVINLVPMIAMLPLFVPVLRRRDYGRDMATVLGLWLTAFGYALFVAIVSGGLFSSLYDFALFCVPVFGGLWIVNSTLDREAIFETLTNACLTIATIVSIYGLFQYVSPPAWDVNWVINSGLLTIGEPVPYSLRIFSTLNHPSTLAIFLVFTIITSLHRFSLRRWWLIVPLLVCSLALALTLVRAAWLSFALGLLVYGLCCSRRTPLFVFSGILAGFLIAVTAALSLVPGGAADGSIGDRLSARFSTLGNLQSDNSAVSREQQSATALKQALQEPLGQGLGTVGTSTRLTAADATTVVDNGYLSRFLELGVIGFIAYLAAIGTALILTLRRWTHAKAYGTPAQVDLLSAAIAVQVALIGGELSGDVHNNLPGVFFWLFVGLALRGTIVEPRPRFSKAFRRATRATSSSS